MAYFTGAHTLAAAGAAESGIGTLLTAPIIGGVVAVIGAFWLISTYNRLVRQRNEIENAWAQIDVQLKRRYDLIPNLIETVKGYASHEKSTLEAVMNARNAAMTATNPDSRMQAENMLSGTLRSLFAVAEAYPDLKANTNFMQMFEELTSTENKISFSRQFYNDRVLGYNTTLESFPTNLIAGMFGFSRKTMFELTNEAEREAPKVKF